MKTIELLLLETIENLGIIGDVVKVKPGFARNFLLPRGMGVAPTPKAVEKLAARRAEVEAELSRQRAKQGEMLEKLAELELTLERSTNDQGVLYASVSQHDIAEALREAGFNIDDRHVRVGDQIKRLDTYHIPIVLSRELKTEIKIWVVSDKPVEAEEETEGDESEVIAEIDEAPPEASEDKVETS